jgi:hypothetical protein
MRRRAVSPASGTPLRPALPPRRHRIRSSLPGPEDRGNGVIAILGRRLQTQDIEAEVPEGIPNQAVRTVLENCRTLRFRSHGFEEG